MSLSPDGYEENLVEGEIEDWPEGAPEDVPAESIRPRLPQAPKEPVVGRLESFDREHVICEHELARAIAEVVSKEPVRLFNTEIEFEQFSQAVLDKVHAQKCPMKGA